MDKCHDFELDAMHFVDELMRKARAYDRIKEIAENAEDMFSAEVYELLGLSEQMNELKEKFWDDLTERKKKHDIISD